MWPELYIAAGLTVAVLLGSTLGVRYPEAFARAVRYLFYAVLGIAVVAWPVSYAYCLHVRISRTAVDVRSGAYYFTDHPGATGFSSYLERFDGTTRFDPTTGERPVIPAYMLAIVLSYDIWLKLQRRRRERREKAIAQPARPGGAGG